VTGPTPDDLAALHAVADTDSSALAVHHTLGPANVQAARGDHRHTGADSQRLDPTQLALPASSAKGDLLVATATNWARLARGGDGTLLMADGASSAGLRYRPPPGLLYPVRAVRTTNLSVASPGSPTCDGVALATGDRVLLVAQTSAPQNGVYDYNGSGVAMTRSPDADLGVLLRGGVRVAALSGTAYAGSTWQQSTTGAITVDTTGLTWQLVGLTGLQRWLAETSAAGPTSDSTLAGLTTLLTLNVTIPMGLPTGTLVAVTASIGHASTGAGVGMATTITGAATGNDVTTAGNVQGGITYTKWDIDPSAGAQTYTLTMNTTVDGSSVTAREYSLSAVLLA